MVSERLLKIVLYSPGPLPLMKTGEIVQNWRNGVGKYKVATIERESAAMASPSVLVWPHEPTPVV